jgi:hypothetical protein
MSHRAVAAVAVLVTLVVVGSGRAASREVAGGHRFVHVHEFPSSGVRIAPPTGTPRLSWRRALEVGEEQYGDWDARTPPQVKLADYRDRLRGPARPVLAWVVAYPAAEAVEFGPDFGQRPASRPGRCPVYVAVDAVSGRLLGALQTCEPPYRG